MEYYDAYGEFRGFETPRWNPDAETEWISRSVGRGGFATDELLPKIAPTHIRQQSKATPMNRGGRRSAPLPRIKSRSKPRRSLLAPGRETIFSSKPHASRVHVGSAADPSEDGDLTLLRSIDSKKANIEFACSRQPKEDEDDEEDEEGEDDGDADPTASVEKKEKKKPDGSFMVDLLRSGNTSLSLSEMYKFKKAFYAADDNGNGILEWEEFREAFHVIDPTIPESDVMTWFAKIDTDCGGEVEWDECFNFLISIGEANYFGKPSGDERLRPCEDVFPVPSRYGHLGMMDSIIVIEEHDKYASVGQDGQLKIFYRESLTPCAAIHVGDVEVFDACNIIGSNRIATASSNKHVTFFDATTFGRQKDFLKYKDAPTSLGFSKDFGSYHFAVGLNNGTLFLYSDFRPSLVSHGQINGCPIMELNRHGGRITHMKFVPNIQALVTSSMDGALKTTHVATGREMRSFTPFEKGAGITHFDFVSEFKALVCCAGGNGERGSPLVYVFHPEKLSPLARFEGHEANVAFCLVDNVSNQLLTFDNDKCIKIWDLVESLDLGSTEMNEGKEVGSYQIKNKFYPRDRVSAAVFDSGNSRVIFGATSPIPWLLNRPHKPPKPHSDIVVASVYSSVFQNVITADLAATICVWNYYTGEMAVQFSSGPVGCQLLSMRLSNDERRLITSTDDGCCKIFNFTCGRVLDVVCEGRAMEVQNLIHIDIRDALFFATVHPDRSLRIWPDKQFNAGGKQRDLYTLPDECSFLTQCEERHYIFVGCTSGELIVWQASLASLFVKFFANGQEASPETENALDSATPVSPSADDSPSAGVEFIVPLPPPADKSAQGALLVCCSDAMIRTWDLGSGAEPPVMLSATAANHIGMLFSAHQVSSDKTMLFTADVEGYIKVWDLRGDLGSGSKPRRSSMSSTRKSSLVARPGKPTQVDHWKTGRRAVNMIGYVESSAKSPSMLVTASGGQEVFFWTLDGVRVGSIGDATPTLWDTLDQSTWDGRQDKAEDVQHGKEEVEEEEEEVFIIKPSPADRRKAVKDAVGRIF